VDQWQSIELSRAVLHTAENILKPGGAVVLKILRGADFDEFLRATKQRWAKVKPVLVQASRDRSTEAYLVLRDRIPKATEE
jgi:23S rRNA (uridine2552-2'-O)-methyltransferase